MVYTTRVKLVARSELKNLENFLDRLIGVDVDQYGGHDPTTDKWDGKYEFSFISGSYFVKADFNRIARDSYKGTLTIRLAPELENLVLQNLPSLAPSLAKGLKKTPASA